MSPIIQACRDCRGSGSRVRSIVSTPGTGFEYTRIRQPCPYCDGTGFAPYRRWPTQCEWREQGFEPLSWDEVRGFKVGTCRVCGLELSGRRRVWCGDRMCEHAYYARMYQGVHWIKRTLIMLRGCRCEHCEEEFESPIVEGGLIYPEPGMLEVDHVLPLADGGDDSPMNLQLLCSPCHRRKTSREATERAATRRRKHDMDPDQDRP